MINKVCCALTTDKAFSSLSTLSLRDFRVKKPLFLTENIKLNGLRTKIKWKIHTCFAVYQFLKVLLIKNYKDKATSSFISCFTRAFTPADIIFYKFLEFTWTLSEKYFHHKLEKIFFISLQKLFLFSRKSKFRTLHFQISWCHQMPKCKTRNTFYWITWEVNSLLVKFGKFIPHKKINCNFCNF